MTENSNLLEDFTQKDVDLIEYRKSYFFIKISAIVILIVTYLSYAMVGFFKSFYSGNENPSFFYREILSGFFGISLIVFLPASVLSLIIAILMTKKFSYKERFKKIFWLLVLVISTLCAVAFCTTVFFFAYRM